MKIQELNNDEETRNLGFKTGERWEGQGLQLCCRSKEHSISDSIRDKTSYINQ